MRLEHLSASSIKSWQQCEFKWMLNYHLKNRISLRENYAAHLGSHMHEIFEKIAKKELTKENWNEWSKQEQPKLYELAAEKYIKEILPDKVNKDCIELFNCLFRRKPVYNPLENPFATIIGIEKEFEFDLGITRVKGFMDLVLEIDKETIEVVDYKTGNSKLNMNAAMKDVQVLLYHLAAQYLFPAYKYVLVTLDYLRGAPVTVALQDKHDNSIRRILTSTWHQIRNCKSPDRIKDGDNWVCKYCCDRTKCDEYWNLYLKCDNLNEFEEKLATF